MVPDFSPAPLQGILHGAVRSEHAEMQSVSELQNSPARDPQSKEHVFEKVSHPHCPGPPGHPGPPNWARVDTEERIVLAKDNIKNSFSNNFINIIYFLFK